MYRKNQDDSAQSPNSENLGLNDDFDEDIDISDLNEKEHSLDKGEARRRIEDYLEYKRMKDLLSDDFDDIDYDYDIDFQ